MRADIDIDIDIDVFVVRPDTVDPEDQLWRAHLDVLSARGRAWTGNLLNALEFSESETAANIRAHEPVLDDVHRDGITLVGPASYIASLKRRKTE